MPVATAVGQQRQQGNNQQNWQSNNNWQQQWCKWRLGALWKSSSKINRFTRTLTLTPTQIKYRTNQFSALSDDKDNKTAVTSNHTVDNKQIEYPRVFKWQGYQSKVNAWQLMLNAHEAKHSNIPQTMLKTGGIKIAIDISVADAGVTSHFVLPGAPVLDITPTQHPLVITRPDGQTLQSTHTCDLNTPWLPMSARRAHIVPGLAHTLLISIKSLCERGCKVACDEDEVRVYFKRKLVCYGNQKPSTVLWVLPWNKSHPEQMISKSTEQSMMLAITTQGNETSFSAYKMTPKQALTKYLNQSLFSPPETTLIWAFQQNHFTTWPGFTAVAVK